MPLTTYTAGEVLTAASLNANLSFAASSPASGLTLISATTIGTTVSSVTVTNAFSATYNNYKIVISGGLASAAVDLQLQLGATTTGYYAGYALITYSSGAIAGKGNNNAANFSDFGAGNANGLNVSADILAPFLTKNTFVVGGQALNVTTNRNAIFSGFLNDTTSYTAFTILVSGGTATGGTILVYGYQNS